MTGIVSSSFLYQNYIILMIMSRNNYGGDVHPAVELKPYLGNCWVHKEARGVIRRSAFAFWLTAGG
jgi:hypothetical protein